MTKQKTQKNEKSLEDWAEEYMVCNEFAVAYKRENPEAIIKYGETEEGDLHAYIYDPHKNKTLDATLSQFSILNPEYKDNYWNGDNHPFVEEKAKFDDIIEFVREFGGTTVLTESEEEVI